MDKLIRTHYLSIFSLSKKSLPTLFKCMFHAYYLFRCSTISSNWRKI